MTTRRTTISESLIREVRNRLAANQTVRRTLPDGGRVHVDRQLPFLAVYRPPPDGSDDGIARFVRGEASYLIAPHDPKHRARVTKLASGIAEELEVVFGGFLVLELWSGPDSGAELLATGQPQKPAFRVIVPRSDVDAPSVVQLVASLRRIRILGRPAEVELVGAGRLSPPGLPRLSRTFGTKDSPVRMIGIEVRPIHRDASTGDEFPGVARGLHRQVSAALQQAAYQFALHQTTHRPRHYQALGRRNLVKAVAQVDSQLADVASMFDLLLLVSPVNADQAYRAFRRKKGSVAPRLLYRPIDFDPSMLKRRLYKVPVERIDDPTLSAIFRDKQRELSLKLDLLSDRQTKRFVHTGVALYGDVDDTMVATAETILERLPPEPGRSSRTVDATAFAAAAARELDRYRQVYPDLNATVSIRDDITSLMVASGHLLIGSGVRIPVRRVEALVQHEVGTHVVTYWNGAAQRLRLLSTGLAGHDELQEGLAVLAEYLVAGLNTSRLRILAARVVAARTVLDGAEFLDTYRRLSHEHGFSERAAFQVTMRVHRGGGFVKDAVYLRGLQQVVDFLADGGRLDTLLVGKIAVEQVAVIEELQRRGVLQPPPLRPAYLDEPDTHYRMERLRGGIDLTALTEPT